MVGTGEFTKTALAGKKFSDASVAYDAALIKADGTYSAALINFSDALYSTQYNCVGYLSFTWADMTITIYTGYDSGNARSLQDVAQRCIDDPKYDYTDYMTILETFAAGSPVAPQ